MANELTNAINQQNEQNRQANAQQRSTAMANRISAINAAAAQAANDPSKIQSYTISTTSGKQYTVDRNQMDWIKSRYKQDWAGTYGVDDADQYAYKNGQMSAKWRKTYGNSNVDRQLAEMGMPSEKNLEKYIADYQNWHTGGISDYFGKDTPQDFYTKTKEMFKGDWQYDDTQEDQLRKSSGQMPSKLAAKYTDTEIDDELRAAGLPPVAEMGKYIGRYNNYSRIDNFYKNAAVSWANLGMTQDKNGQYIQNDNKVYTMEDGRQRKGKDLYAEAFYDEMRRKDEKGDYVYGNIFGMFKNNHLEDYDPDDYDGTNYNQYLGKEFVNASKVSDLADDYAAYTAFSYDDFAGKYGDYYDKYLKNFKFSNGQTLEQIMANVERAQDEEAQKAYYSIEDKWFDGDVGIDSFIKKYQQDYPSNSYEQMFTDMFDNGVSDKIVNKAMRAIRKSATQNKSEDGNSGYYDITNAYIRAKEKSSSAQSELWDSINADPRDVDVSAPSGTESVRLTKDEYKGLDKEMWDYIDSSIKADEQDIATINTASDAIKNSLNMLFDADEGTVAEGDVDAVINLLNGIEKQNWNNPVAMRAALKEYGFNEDGTLFGTAAALTAGWSDESKRKLLRSIGNTVYSGETLDKDMEAALKAAGGNTELGSSKILHPDKKMDKEKFSYALEWAQEQIASGKLTEGDAYNILAGSGFQDELDEYMPEEWHRAVFEDFSVPALFEQTGGAQLAMWEEMTPEEQKKTASDMWNALTDEEKQSMFGDPNWWKSNPYIYRTFGQALEQQFSAVIPSLATDLAAGGVETVDAILANISGRPEMWGITQDLMDAEQFVNAYGSVYDNTNGAQIASIAADATAEIAKMFMLGSLGAEIGAAFETTEVGSLIAGAAGSTTPVVKQVAGLFLDSVKASPFMVSAFAHNYAKAKTMGATNGEATRFGVVTGLLEGFWEGCNFDKLWGRVIGGDKFANMLIAGGEAFSESSVINMARIANMVVSGFSEWTEESLGYVGETLWETTSRWGQGKSEWSFEDYWEQASMGFLTGFIGAGISSGAINRESILYNYWSKNGKIASHIMDVAVAESIYNQATEAERDEWRNGDIHVMSQEDYAGLMVRLDTLNRQQDSEAAKAEYKDREDKANKKYNDVKAVENKFRAEAAALNPLDAEDAKKIGKLAPKVEEAARASSEAALVREDTIKKAAISMDERIEQENSEREKINRLVREHFAALYLQNESAIARRNEEEIRANVSRDRQNGAEVTPETRATVQEAPANNVAQPEAKPATTENPEAAAREAAYDRVYTDQEAGKAYGSETKNAKGRKLTRVEFAENERQNFQAKTTAKQGKVTLELAGLEAAEGMSDKEIIAEAKKAMTPDAAKKLDMFMKLSKALGMPMVIRDVVAGTSGYVHDGKLYVTLNGKQALLRVTAHEVTHWMKEHLPSGYDVLRTRLINDVGGQAAFDELVQKKAQDYGLDLSTEKGRLEADDEVCAELCEKMFENKDALEKFVNEAPEAAKTLKARLAKTLVAIKQAIKSLGTSSSKTSGDLIKDQDTIELWYKTLSDAIDAANAEAKGKVQPTIEDVATETETSTEAQPQAPPAPEGVEELGISAEEVRKQNLRSELEELAKKGTKVKDFDRASVNEILDRVIVGDRTNYSKADYAQIRGMLAQLIPEIKAMVDGDTSVDLDALNERVQTALNYMLDRYSEPSAELYDLREIIPGKIALTETAYNELRKNSQMTLREASNRMTRALGKFVNFVYKGSPNYSAASTIDEVWRDIGYEPDGQGNIAEDADALIKYVEERAERSSYDDLYKSQREDMVSAHAGEFLDAVQSMVEGKNADKSEAARYTLDPVDPIEPTSNLWSRTATTTEAKEAFHDLWDVSSEESEENNPTQRKSTESTYRKIYDILQKEGFSGKILDASSGMGYGTRLGREEYGFDVEDIEPYPGKDYNPMYKDYSTLNEKYDAIISSAVLNVLPQDQRDALVVKMGQMLNPGGKMYITTRGTKGDVDNLAKTGKNIQLGPSEFVETVHGSYQKGFTNPELKAYLEDALGPGFTVEVSNKDNGGKFNGNTSIVVTKNGSDVLYAIDDDYMPLAERYDAGIATEEESEELQSDVLNAAKEAMPNTKIVDENGNPRIVYHGTSERFTVFDRTKGRSTMDIQGMFFSPYEIEAGGYGENVGSYYLNIQNPAPESVAYSALRRFQGQNNAGAKAMEYLASLGYDGVDNEYDEYIAFYPDQIKSADLVTYDNDGNIIPLSERFDQSKVDTRWSVDDDWDEAVRRYGAKPQGMNPRARDVQVPERLNGQSRLSDFLRSLTESGKVTDDQANDIKKMVVEQNYMSYIPTSVADRMEQAQKYIAQRQPLQAQQEFHDMVTEGKGGANTVALGIQLLSDAAERGDIESVLDTAADLQILATDSGQSVQAFSVLKQLKGVGSAWYMQKLVDRLNSKYADRIAAGKMDTITVSPELMAQLAAATNVNEIEAAEEAVAKEIAGQLPLTWTDRLSNWRYFSMLANPVTHFRNIFGNVLMGGMNMAKDVVAVGAQRAAEKIGLARKEDRAHAVLTAEDRKTWGDWAQKSYDENARNLRGGGKLGFETFVKQNMRSFDTKFLNALAKFNFDKLEGEDIRFIRPAYKNALMQYMKAQGYTLNAQGEVGKYAADGTFTPISNAKMTEAEEWASNQAWKATFRDASDLATMLNKVSKMNSVSRLLVEGVMPFKKTPINIAKRGIEYSPAGIVMGVAQLTNGVKKGKYTPAQAIDTLASGLTGSALMALGVFLAKLGVIRGGGEDKKKYETYLEDTGDQTYAFKIGDVSINMSSIAPATIPLFMGVALEEMLNRQGDSFDLSTFTDTIAGTLNPLMEMSFMSSLNSALQNYNNNGIGGALGNTLLTAAQNYGSQYLPTAVARLGQLADPVQRTTKSSATSPIGGNMDYYARSLAKKVPGATAALEPDVNVWGQTNTKDTFGEWLLDVANKFVLPTNVKITNRDAVDKELIRLVESTGGVDFLPSDGNKYFTVSGQTYKMNARQYTEFSKERGEASYAAIKEVMNSPAYANANDTQRADMLEKALKAAQKQVNTNWKYKLGAFD